MKKVIELTNHSYSSVAGQRIESDDDCDGQAAIVGLATNFSSEFNFKLSN